MGSGVGRVASVTEYRPCSNPLLDGSDRLPAEISYTLETIFPSSCNLLQRMDAQARHHGSISHDTLQGDFWRTASVLSMSDEIFC